MEKRLGYELIKRILGVLLPVLFFTGCAPSLTRYKEIGVSGNIDSTASVKGFASVDIRAPIKDVWKSLIQAREWPEWNGEIKRVKLADTLSVGKRFVWGPTFPKIQSEVVLCTPEQRLVWIGTMLHFKAIHSWKLVEKDGLTSVSTEESLHGAMVTLVFGKRKLDENLKNWLASLKLKAENDALNQTPTIRKGG